MSPEGDIDFVSPIPTPETALLSLQVGKPFKPEGRKVVPQDCALYDDCLTEEVPLNAEYRIAATTSENIRMLLESDRDSPNDQGRKVKLAYYHYCDAMKKGDVAMAETANTTFKEIAGFGLREVIEFENEVRRLHGIPLRPLI